MVKSVADGRRMAKKNKAEKASESTLNSLHEKLAQHFVDKLDSGEITSSDTANIIKFLANNNITANIEKGDDLDKVAEKIFDTDFDETN